MKPRNVCLLLLVLLIGLISFRPVLAQYMGDGGGQGGAHVSATEAAKIQDWFTKYDNIRRQAQMNPQQGIATTISLLGPIAILLNHHQGTFHLTMTHLL